MDFGNLLNDDKKCKDIALRHWNDGKLPDGSNMTQMPLVGERWPAEFLPYWRKWMAQSASPVITHFPSWATVHDKPFWKRVVERVADDNLVGQGLVWAGMHGNHCAFAAASPRAIDHYAKRVFAAPTSTSFVAHRRARQAKMVHPDVMLFMRDRGIWSQADIERLISTYSLDELDGTGLVSIDPRHRGIWGLKSSFYKEWAVKALGKLGLDSELQAHVIAHFITCVTRTFWTGAIREECTPLLHPNVDLVMLQLSVGLSISWSMGTRFERQIPEMRTLYTTVASVAEAIAKRTPWVADSTSHPGLALCMDLQGVSTPMDLYRMAVQCSRVAMGHCGHDARIESTPLPSLE